MSSLKKIAKKVPFLHWFYRLVSEKYDSFYLNSKSVEQVFTTIYTKNTWGGKDSVSGTGSDVYQTRVLIEQLPVLFSDLGVFKVLDIPCGDFHWMNSVDLSGVEYIGADIVNELVTGNSVQYSKSGVCFQRLDLIKSDLPKVDLVFCRDCLVHLSFKDILSALKNICNSESEYLLTTTFVDREENRDIATGQWRVLNLELAPFFLSKPIRILKEDCPEADGAYLDKALGLWRIADIRDDLKAHT
jgi:hypothetical protein